MISEKINIVDKHKEQALLRLGLLMQELETLTTDVCSIGLKISQARSYAYLTNVHEKIRVFEISFLNLLSDNELSSQENPSNKKLNRIRKLIDNFDWKTCDKFEPKIEAIAYILSE